MVGVPITIVFHCFQAAFLNIYIPQDNLKNNPIYFLVHIKGIHFFDFPSQITVKNLVYIQGFGASKAEETKDQMVL